MSAPKGQQPARGHHLRAHLYEMGVSRVGEDAAASMPEHQVRRHGVRRAGNALLLAAGVAVATIGGGALLGNAIDRSPTQKHLVEIEKDKVKQEQGLMPQAHAGAEDGESGEHSQNALTAGVEFNDAAVVGVAKIPEQPTPSGSEHRPTAEAITGG